MNTNMETGPVDTSSPKRRKLIWLVVGTAIATAVIAFGVAGLLVNIFEHKQEARNPFFRVVEITDDTEEVIVVTTLTVLNDNAAPVFGAFQGWHVLEGERIVFRAFAFDPDNPTFVPPERLDDGSLFWPMPSTVTVSYGADNLPAGAVFDADTAEFVWAPGFTDAGEYLPRFTAT